MAESKVTYIFTSSLLGKKILILWKKRGEEIIKFKYP